MPSRADKGEREIGSAPVGVIFNSDWSTALGTSSNAILDIGKAAP